MSCRRTLSVVFCAAFLCTAVGNARAIDRDCPRKQVWDPNQGSCVKKRKVRKKSPAQKYYEAIEHLEGTGKRPDPKRGVALLEQACAAKHAPSCTLLGFLFLNGRSVAADAAKSLRFYQRACKLKEPLGCVGAAEVHSRGLLGHVDNEKAVPLLQTACDMGSGKGCYTLAEKHQNAMGVAENKQLAAQLYEKAFGLMQADCPKGVAPSCHYLGLAYFQAKGTKQNLPLGFKAFERGCAAGSGDACYEIGKAYRHGNGTKADNKKALRYYDQACGQYDSAGACHDAGVVIALGEVDSPRPQALKQFGERACKLDERRCDILAHLYATGKGGVAEDQNKAAHWYLKACDQGNEVACSSAGYRAFEGTGMKRDIARALELWQRSCDYGSASACRELGEKYYEGEHTAKDYEKAFQLFHIGCVRRDAYACHWGGFALEAGNDGTGKQKPEKAALYFDVACDLKRGGGCVSLGKLHRDGKGLDKNPDKAKELFDKACDMGYVDGCVQLGHLYYQGEGLPKDELLAGQAFIRACKIGAKKECYWIDNLFKTAKANAQQNGNAVKELEAACHGEKPVDNACLTLANLYAFGGYLAEKNGRKGFKLYEDGCNRKVQDACAMLPHMYAQGIGVVRNTEKAKAMFTEQCDGDSPKACLWLGVELWKEEKHELAVPLFQRACTEGDGGACNYVGFAHYTGKGVRWDAAAARKHYEKGCELGEPVACANVGELLEHGIAIGKDLAKALEHYQKGCTPTTSAGCTRVGHFYERGLGGVDKDVARAEAEYKRGCNDQFATSAEACRALAELYKSTGKGSASETAKLFQQALDLAVEGARTNPYGKYLLGTFYRDGIALVRDPQKAVEQLAAACDGYDPLGCLAAGRMYLGDAGIPADLEAAAVRFDRACAAGIEEACAQAEQARTGRGGGEVKGPTPIKKKGSCACELRASSAWRSDLLGAALLLLGCALLLRRRRQ